MKADGNGNGTNLISILIIEDNCDLAEALCNVLSILGHRVAIEESGTSGLCRAKAIQPDVIICDIGIPGMNGIQVAKEINEDPKLSHARLIAISGYSDNLTRQKISKVKFDRFLLKPFKIEALIETIAEVLI